MSDSLIDAILRRDFYLTRFSNHQINDQGKTALQEISAIISPTLDKYGKEFTDSTKAEQQSIKGELEAAVIAILLAQMASATKELYEVSRLDVKHVASIYDEFTGANFKVPSDQQIDSFIKNVTMIMNENSNGQFSGYYNDYERKQIESIARSIVNKLVSGGRNGESNKEIATAIRGKYNSKSGQWRGGLVNTGNPNHWLNTLIRTAMSHFSNSARDRLYQANKDVIQDRVLIATLDNRTTFICRSRDLMRWDINDDTYPRLPFHPNERSVYVVGVKGLNPLAGAERPAVEGRSFNEDDYKSRGKYRGRRDLDIYNVRRLQLDVTHEQWLKRQPRAFVVSSLGKSRAKLFLDGNLELGQFVDKYGKTINLSDLRQIGENNKAFIKSGL